MPSISFPTLFVTLLVAASSVYIMSFFRRKNHLPVAGRNVIVTGGSQGMGKSVAILLSSMGANVAIVARDPQKLQLAIAEISNAAQNSTLQKFTHISADLSRAAEAKRAIDDAEKSLGSVDILWHCAGGATPGFFKDQDPEQFEYGMKINYFSAVYTAHAVLNAMLRAPTPSSSAPKRTLIFTSSVLSFAPIIGYAQYSPAKSAIRTLADTLRQECLLYDISVSCCFPGTIYSPGFDQENITKPEVTKVLEGADEGQTPDVVAQQCLKGLQKGEMLVTTSFLGDLMKGGMWGMSPKSSKLWDVILSYVVAIVWLFVGPDLDGKVLKYKKEHGVPAKNS